MNEADRIARERLRAENEATRAEEVRRDTSAAAEARRQLDAIRSLSRDVLNLLEARHCRDFEPEALALSVPRLPLLGELLGRRKIVKGGWKIAEWKFDFEKPPHTVWLLADGRYCWNRQIVTFSTFADWHQRSNVSNGPSSMETGLSHLKEKLETSTPAG